MKKYLIILIISCSLFSCDSTTFTPKPKGLNYIELPSHTYATYSVDSLPYEFEFSKQAKVSVHNNIPERKIINYNSLGAKIWLTYYEINDEKNTLEELINTTYKLTHGHNKRADAILYDSILTPSGKTGIMFKLEGEVSSQYQFYTHDTTNNFLRGALYFETATKNDSLKPIIEYVKEDINHLVNTLEWK